MNHNLPQSVQEILDDPMEDENGDHSELVRVTQCLSIQKILEHRLTKLETQAKFLNVESVRILMVVILALLKPFFNW